MRNTFALLVCVLLTLACGGPTASGWKAGTFVADEPVTGGKGFTNARDDVAPPPISLTAADGTGLRLVSLRIAGVADDPLALTELHMEFENPRDEQMEGRFEIALPSNARVTRFAMKIGAHWQEGEVVERQRARVTYESFLHRRRDPALLERKAGNQFRARVFPIAPRERKQLILSYAQTFADPEQPYRVHLVGLPRLDELDVRVQVHEHGGDREAPKLVERRRRDLRPDADLTIPRAAAATAAARSGRRFIARIAPLGGEAKREPVEALTVLLDTSASRALDFGRQLDTLVAVLDELRANGPHKLALRVVVFDQRSETVFDGKLTGFGPAELDAIRTRGSLGASDLGAALEHLAKRRAQHARVLLVTDGIATAGPLEAADLRAKVTALANAGVQRLDVMLDGGIRDEETMRKLVTAGLPSAGLVLDASAGASALADKLTRATVSGIDVSVAGAEWVWPRRIDGVQPGDHVLVHGELARAKKTLAVKLSGPIESTTTLKPQVRDGPLLDRALVSARVEALIGELGALSADAGDRAEDLRQEIIELSTEHRILNDYTALLVLETKWDYQRFGIERRGIADILVVQDTGVGVHRRSRPKATVARRSTKRRSARQPTGSTNGKGTIQGVVADARTRRKLEGAVVVLQCSCLEGARETRTNASGLYSFGGLPPGTYTIQTLIGRADVSKVTTLPAGAKFRANFTVDPANTFRRQIIVESKPARRSLIERDTDRAMRRAEHNRPRPSRGASRSIIVDSRPARADTAVATDVDMAQAKSIPVGSSTSRDFTATVQMTPAATRDSAGISIAGTTAAESRFVLDGASVGASSFGTTVGAPEPARARRGALRIRGKLARRPTRRAIRRGHDQIEQCYLQRLAARPRLRGRIKVDVRVRDDGLVDDVRVLSSSVPDRAVARCVEDRIRQWTFPEPKDGRTAHVIQSYRFLPGDASATTTSPTRLARRERRRLEGPAAHRGTLGRVMRLIEAGKLAEARDTAWGWRAAAPGDVLALIALGEALEASGQHELAARAYGSIIDLFPSRADMRRFAGGRLERLDRHGLALAVDTYEKARTQRPDHPSSHRLLAYALVRHGRHERAFDVLEAGLTRSYPDGRFAGHRRILGEDLGLVAAAWIRQRPHARRAVLGRLAALGLELQDEPSLRFVLTWESDANDVDLHVEDAYGGHAYYERPELESGGLLFADVTNGFGPECLAIDDTPRGFPYGIKAHYYNRGPMGYGMGKVQVVQHDGNGNLAFDDRPFVVMTDGAYVDLGEVSEPLLDTPRRAARR